MWKKQVGLQFLVLFLSIALIWYLFLAWDGTSLLCGNDSLLEMLYYREVLKARGDWAVLLFNTQIVGGTAFHGQFGTTFFYQLFGWLNLPPVLAYNLTHLLIQSLIGFLGVKSLPFLIKEGKPISEIFKYILALFIAFQPTYMWRLGWGHQNFLSGILVLFSFLYLIRQQENSKTMFFICWVALCQGVTSLGQQLNLYLALFLLPLLLILARNWLSSFFIGLSVLLFALPQLSEALRLSFTQDAARSLSEAPVIYAYLTGRWNDILSFFVLDPHLISVRKNLFLFHEAHYFLGPFILIFLYWGLKKRWALTASLLFASLMILCIALNISPVSDFIIAHVGVIGAFRTPLRGFLLISSLYTLFSLAVVCSLLGGKSVKQDSFTKRDLIILAIIGAGLALTLSGWAREIYFIILSLGILFTLFLKKYLSLLPTLFFILLFCFISISQENITYGESKKVVEEETFSIGHKIKLDPLTRVLIEQQLSYFNSNTAWALNIPSLDGYFAMPIRFLHFFAELTDTQFNQTVMNLKFSQDKTYFPVLRQLYNICCTLDLKQGLRSFDVKTNGPAWFGQSFKSVSSWKDLANELKVMNDQSELYKKQILLKQEEKNKQLAVVDPICALAEVKNIMQFHYERKLLEIDYSAKSECPLVLSLNYSSLFKAKVLDKEAFIFPAFGSLAGVLLPAGEGRLEIYIEPLFSNTLRLICYFLSFLIFIFVLFRYRGSLVKT